MVMTSTQIAQMNGTYQSQHMQGMQMAGMIGMGGSGGQFYGQNPNEMYAERAAGRGLNLASAMAPIGMAGMAIAGADPISLGVRGGMAASAMGLGAIGGAGVGVGIAGAAAVPMLAAGYGMNQMMTGAQQQQQLNSSMRQNFTFQNASGGRGFSSQQLGSIGTSLRAQTYGVGQMGEQVGFEELTRLAGGMGQMGMGRNIRSVREFNERFREMVTSLKEIATEMGTSLEQAQQMAVGMKRVGIFNMGDAARVSREVAGVARAANISTSEVTGMQTIGAQIGRSIGGRGRSGQMGGIRAIESVGMSLQTGALTEEDIYNVTGLTGAEGRRAYATQGLQKSARFLRGGLGRRMMASMAGEGGQLDADAVAEVEAGGVGTGRTMQMAHQGIGRAGGRASFLRREGQMRGEVLGRFGPHAGVKMMQSWLQQRGIDTEGDRGKLFMQRRLGMTTEELDTATRAIEDVPRQEALRMQSDANRGWMMSERRRLATTGFEGVKRKFEQARNTVQNKMRQAGADTLGSLQDAIGGFFNELTDTYVDMGTQGVEEALGGFDVNAGDPRLRMIGQDQASGRMRSMAANLRPPSARLRSDQAPRVGAGGAQASWQQGAWEGMRQGLSNRTNASSGFATKYRDELRRFYTSRLSDPSMTNEQRIQSMRDFVREKAEANPKGEVEQAMMRQMAESSRAGGPRGAFMQASNTASDYMQLVRETMGFGVGADEIRNLEDPGGGRVESGFFSAARADFLRGTSILGLRRDTSESLRAGTGVGGVEWKEGGAAETIRRPLLAAGRAAKDVMNMTPIGFIPRGAAMLADAIPGVSGVEGWLNDMQNVGATLPAQYASGTAAMVSGEFGDIQAASKYMRSKKGMQQIVGLMGGGGKREYERAQERYVELNRRGDLGRVEGAELDVLRSGLISRRYAEMTEGGAKDLTDEQKKQLETEARDLYGRDLSIEQIEQKYADNAEIVRQTQEQNDLKFRRKIMMQSQETEKGMIASGYGRRATGGELAGQMVMTDEMRAEIEEETGEAGLKASQSAMDLLRAQGRFGRGGGGYDAVVSAKEQFSKGLLSMTPKDMRALARIQAKAGNKQSAAILGERSALAGQLGSRSVQRWGGRYGGRGKGIAGVGAVLGLRLGKRDIAKMAAETGGSGTEIEDPETGEKREATAAEDVAGRLIERTGVDVTTADRARITAAVKAQMEGKTGLAAKEMSEVNSDTKQKIRRESERGDSAKSLDAIRDSMERVADALAPKGEKKAQMMDLAPGVASSIGKAVADNLPEV